MFPNVAEVGTACTIRAMLRALPFINLYQSTLRYNPEDSQLRITVTMLSNGTSRNHVVS
jgi:hypothetical protein